MLPESGLSGEYAAEKRIGSRNWRLDFDKKRIDGVVDGKEALMQAIRIALLTERYKYPVFSHAYGTDYKNAFEEGYMKAMGKVRNAISDSLLCDDRIYTVDDFEFERKGTKMIVKFKVESIFGQMKYETEVG